MKKVIMPKDIYELFRREQSFLSRADVSILTTAVNSEVLALHRAEIADLIIAYLDAGEMSGEELCRQIREDAGLRGVSMLLICGAQESEIGRCESCNANAYVQLPVISAVPAAGGASPFEYCSAQDLQGPGEDKTGM